VMGARVLLVLLCMRISFAIVVVLRHIPEAFESFASMQYSLLVRNADLRKPGAPCIDFHLPASCTLKIRRNKD
jgi:hypothetical protein